MEQVQRQNVVVGITFLEQWRDIKISMEVAIAFLEASRDTTMNLVNKTVSLGTVREVEIKDGNFNVFFGSSAGRGNQNGDFNSFIGVGAGFMSQGSHNTAVGGLSFANTFSYGSYNTAVGDSSMFQVDTDGDIIGDFNVAVGAGSLYSKSIKYTNRSVGLGYQAGYKGGVRSVFIGYKAGRDATVAQSKDRLYIANDEGTPLIYGEFDNELVRIQGDFHTTGNVGIGTTNPQARLHIGGTSTTARMLFENAGDIMWKTKNGAIRPILTLHSDDHTYLDGEKDIVFRTKSSFEKRMRIQEDGNVGIGTDNPLSKLHIDGGSVRITGGSYIDDGTTLNVPDYVFQDAYKLKSLGAVEDYIDEHHHLEGFPSMYDVKAWAAMSLQQREMKLLEKVEELTLYLIAQDKTIQLQAAQLGNQTKQLKTLLTQLEQNNIRLLLLESK